MHSKKAFIAANYIGFFHFLWTDIDILNEFGYKVYAAADNSKNEEHTLAIFKDKNVEFFDVRIDSKSPLTMNNMKGFAFYCELFKREKFEIIHCHTPIVGLFIRLAAVSLRRKETKVIYTTHGLSYTHLSGKREYLLYHTIESFASYFCDVIITINNEDYESAKKLHCKHVYHINGVGVNTHKYIKIDGFDRDEYRKSLGIEKNKIMILSVGELSHRKNHAVIVKAIAKLPNKSDYVFAICGREITDGGTSERIYEDAIESGVCVRFLGFRSDIPKVMHCADIGAIPSIREGLGLAGIEQLCAGVPLVGSDVQGIKEYIIKGETGYLCNPYDAVAYADAIFRLSDKDMREKMKPNCFLVVNKFDTSISVDQRRKIYNEIFY